MSAPPEKILALQFKYFGDAVLMTPALRALRAHFPDAELHLLAPAEIAPLFQHLPWLTRVWSMPRRRGRASLRETLPFLRALRRERFDRSVDFASNDRGAILSRLIGAQRRLGWDEPGGFLGRRWCYNERVTPPDESFHDRSGAGVLARSLQFDRVHGLRPGQKNELTFHESARLAALLSGWQVPPPASLECEIRPDPELAGAAKKILPRERTAVCHVASSQPRKEWPLAHWAELRRLATDAGAPVVFTTARGNRESALMNDLRRLAPEATILPEIPELPLFLALLARAGVFISGDTGPLHFAAGLGRPTISLFGPTSPARWGPIGARHQILTGAPCTCAANSAVCASAHHCLANISPEQVAAAVQKALAPG